MRLGVLALVAALLCPAPLSAREAAKLGEVDFLEAAEQQARLACVRFMDGTCPLPKAYEGQRRTAEGKPFPDFYFRGARLMHAFACLGEALRGSTRREVKR